MRPITVSYSRGCLQCSAQCSSGVLQQPPGKLLQNTWVTRVHLQVANLAALGTGNKRYKCRVSDGAGGMEALLGSEAAKLAAAGDIQEGAILCILDYVVNVIKDTQILVITRERYTALPTSIEESCIWLSI